MIEPANSLSSRSARLGLGIVGAAVFGLPVLAWLKTGEACPALAGLDLSALRKEGA